jgi:hypothetical protein
MRDQASYFAAWALLGVGMRCALYDAAFAALVQVVPSRGRLAISYLTLYGAYASTIFWVIGHYLNEAYGWRGTLVCFAAINLAICLPLNWIGLSRREPDTGPAAAKPAETSPEGPALEGRVRILGIALFSLIMSLNGFVFGVVSLQLVPLLESAGLVGAAAVWVASLKGHGQFGGRVVEIFFARNLKAMTVARIAIGVAPLSLLLLMLAHGQLWQLIAFTLLLGASQGVITIVRRAAARAVRRQGLRRGARADRHADPADQRLLADHICADRRPGRLAHCSLCAAGLLDRHLDRHRADVAVVRRRAGDSARSPGRVTSARSSILSAPLFAESRRASARAGQRPCAAH